MSDRSSSDSLGVGTRRDLDRVVVAVRGDLDLATTASLERAVRTARASGPSDVVLDLGGLTFVDCAGLGALLALDRDARGNGWNLAISAPSPPLSRLLEITGLGGHFDRADRR